MSDDADHNPAPQPVQQKRGFTEAARAAAQAAKAAKRAQPDPFGVPEVFIVAAGGKSFTWELRRFGGVVLQRSAEVLPDAVAAREAGERALAALLATPELPTFKKGLRPK